MLSLCPTQAPLPCVLVKKTPVFLTSSQISPSLLSALLALGPLLSPEKNNQVTVTACPQLPSLQDSMSPSGHPERERPAQNYNPTIPRWLDNCSCYTERHSGSKRKSRADAGLKGDTGRQAWGTYLRASPRPLPCLRHWA